MSWPAQCLLKLFLGHWSNLLQCECAWCIFGVFNKETWTFYVGPCSYCHSAQALTLVTDAYPLHSDTAAQCILLFVWCCRHSFPFHLFTCSPSLCLSRWFNAFLPFPTRSARFTDLVSSVGRAPVPQPQAEATSSRTSVPPPQPSSPPTPPPSVSVQSEYIVEWVCVFLT